MKGLKGIGLLFIVLTLIGGCGIPKKPENQSSPENQEPPALEGVQLQEKISANTRYVLEERDLLKSETMTTEWTVPPKYVGMNRESFLEAMKRYENSPPLVELERGFVGLQVLSFSSERVIVQMNYRYVQPGSSFYIACLDNEVIVLLEDGKTVYLYTGIALEKLSDKLQSEIIQMKYIEDEKTLYDFLETSSS